MRRRSRKYVFRLIFRGTMRQAPARLEAALRVSAEWQAAATIDELTAGRSAATCTARRASRTSSGRRCAAQRALEDSARGIVVLGADGALLDASPLYERWFEPGRVPEPGTYAEADVELVVRRVGGDPTLLLLDERRLAPDPVRVRELGISRRESQIVALAGRGLTNTAIGVDLNLSERTVHKHLENAYRKLGVHSRLAAARLLLGDR